MVLSPRIFQGGVVGAATQVLRGGGGTTQAASAAFIIGGLTGGGGGAAAGGVSTLISQGASNNLPTEAAGPAQAASVFAGGVVGFLVGRGSPISALAGIAGSFAGSAKQSFLQAVSDCEKDCEAINQSN